MKKSILKIAGIVLSLVVLGIFLKLMVVEVGVNKKIVQGLTLPHHLLVEDKIEEVYSTMANEDVKTVVILSPNHFGYGFNWIQTSSKVKKVDLAEDLLEQMVVEGLIYDEPKLFEKEHGIYVHYPFMVENFEKASILPLSFKLGTPQKQLDDLIESFKDLENVVYVASIDFTHLEKEEVALQNDNRTIQYLKDWSEGKVKVDLEELKALAVSLGDEAEGLSEAVAFDSPESLYVLLRIMEESEVKDFELLARTSTFTELNLDEAEKMTSHIFGKFDK